MFRKGIEPITMPLMTLVSTAIDQIAPHPDITIYNCMKYLPTDSALFFTSDDDRLLLSQQRQNYFPVVKWFNKFFKVQLEVTNSIFKKIDHSPEAIAKIRSYLENMVGGEAL
jgi:chaperone required for assembly of F1-ATPase